MKETGTHIIVPVWWVGIALFRRARRFGDALLSVNHKRRADNVYVMSFMASFHARTVIIRLMTVNLMAIRL